MFNFFFPLYILLFCNQMICITCREYKLLNLLEFNSSRKRMSVIVRDEDDDIFLFCKGADEYGYSYSINMSLVYIFWDFLVIYLYFFCFKGLFSIG